MSDLKPVGVKAPLALLPRNALCAIAGVVEHGAAKYSPWNWQDGDLPQARIEEYYSAALRHIYAASDPSEEDMDEESGIHHLAHAGACVVILLWKLGISYQPSLFLKERSSIGPVDLAGEHAVDQDSVLEQVSDGVFAKGTSELFTQPGPQAELMGFIFKGTIRDMDELERVYQKCHRLHKEQLG